MKLQAVYAYKHWCLTFTQLSLWSAALIVQGYSFLFSWPLAGNLSYIDALILFRRNSQLVQVSQFVALSRNVCTIAGHIYRDCLLHRF